MFEYAVIASIGFVGGFFICYYWMRSRVWEAEDNARWWRDSAITQSNQKGDSK